MPDKEKSIGGHSEGQNVQKGVRIELNETYIPDYQFTPPTPPTPASPPVDQVSPSDNSDNSGD